MVPFREFEQLQKEMSQLVPSVSVEASGTAALGRRHRSQGVPAVSTRSGTRRPAAAAWKRVGQSLVRELEFRDFPEALAFLERVAAAAEAPARSVPAPVLPTR